MTPNKQLEVYKREFFNKLYDTILEGRILNCIKSLENQVSIKFNPRLHFGCAGKATHSKKLIELCPGLLTTEERLRETLGHELAHLITRAVFGPIETCHGPLWRNTMILFGLEPKARHDYLKGAW